MGSLSMARTPKTHSCTRRSGSPATNLISGQRPTVLEVTAHDQIAGRVALKPALPTLHQLPDLIFSDPVVLVVIEHGNENVEMIEQSLEAGPPR